MKTKYTNCLLIFVLTLLVGATSAFAHPPHPQHPPHPHDLQVNDVEIVGPIAGSLALVWGYPADLPDDSFVEIEVLDAAGNVTFAVQVSTIADNYLMVDSAFYAGAVQYRLQLYSGQKALGAPVVYTLPDGWPTP